MKESLKVCLILLAAVALVVAPGCKKADIIDTPAEEAQPVAVETLPPAPEPEPVREVREDDNFNDRNEDFEQPSLTVQEINDQGILQTVYFDFDQSELTGISETILRRNADWMKNNRQYSVVIQGHCDNRGTIEYNLALGQRRANAVREYLASQGVQLSRLRTVTYGEERPERQGNNEAAWAKNRRAEFVVE